MEEPNVSSEPMIVRTTNGSIYEVDTTNKLVRRLSGRGQATVRVGEDGSWKSYHSINFSEQGLLIVWRITPEGVAQSTLTSPLILDSEAKTITN